MTMWIAATDLIAHERFGLSGDEHEVREVSRDRHLVWVATEDGRLIPLHETERVLLLGFGAAGPVLSPETWTP
jgi:hypothetical protein